MYKFDREQSSNLMKFIYDTKLGNNVINGLLDKLNAKEKMLIEKRINEEYINNNPLEPVDSLPVIQKNEYEAARKQIETLCSNIKKQYKCKMCGSIHNGNGKCSACGRDNEPLQSDIKSLNEILVRLPDDFFEKEKIDSTLTKLYHLVPMKINKVNELLTKYNYEITFIKELAKLKNEQDAVLNNKVKLSKNEYDFIVDVLINDELSKEFLNIKYLLLDFCMKAAIEKADNFDVTQEQFEDIFRKMAEKISKEEAGAFKIDVKFVDKEDMKKCDGLYIDLFKEIHINRNTLMSNPIEGLSTIYHEIIHQWQSVELNKRKTINRTTFMQIMDYVNRQVIGNDYYNNNYEWLFSELQAILSEDAKTFDYLKSIYVEVPKDYLEKSQKKDEYFYNYVKNNTYLYRKVNNQWYTTDYLFEQSIYNHPEYFEKFPQLSMFYKQDDSHIVRKDLAEIMNDYDNFKNGLINWNGNHDEIDYIYNYTISNLKQASNQNITDQANEIIQKMEQGIDIESTNEYVDQTNNNKQKGYSIIGILGLITCIATIGIILYGYILFYK